MFNELMITLIATPAGIHDTNTESLVVCLILVATVEELLVIASVIG
jgi:hypothetical protein